MVRKVELRMFKVFTFFLLISLCGCSSKKTQMIVIDSNVSAFVYYKEERLGMTPFAEKIQKHKIGSLELKQAGYKTVKLSAEKSFDRSMILFSSVSFQVTKEEEPVAGLILFISLPLSVLTDTIQLSSGESIEYMPNAYYIELVPLERKQAAVEILKNIQIKKFALKLYPSLALGEEESLKALSALSGKTQSEIRTQLLKSLDAPSFATALVN